MKKDNQLTIFEEFIETTGIYPTIKVLENKLKEYKRSKINKDSRYLIAQKFRDIESTLDSLKNKLQDLINESEEWEARE